MEAKLKQSQEDQAANQEKLKYTTKQLAKLEIDNEALMDDSRAHKERSLELERRLESLQEKAAMLEIELEDQTNRHVVEKERLRQENRDLTDEMDMVKRGVGIEPRKKVYRELEESFMVIFFRLHDEVQDGERPEWSESEADEGEAEREGVWQHEEPGEEPDPEFQGEAPNDTAETEQKVEQTATNEDPKE